MAIKFIIDSSTDLPQEIIKKYDIKIASLYVYIDENEYKDIVEINTQMLFKAFEQGKSVKTSQVPVSDFYKCYDSLDENDEYICLIFSSKLSGTYNSAVVARQEILNKKPNLKISVVGMLCAATGASILVMESLKLAEAGANREEIVEYVEKTKSKIKHIFSVTDLSYLVRGGRMSKEKAFFANVLNIKPILTLVEGAIEVQEKVRGDNKKLQRFIECFNEDVKDPRNAVITIGYGSDDTEANKLAEQLKALGARVMFIVPIGSLLSAHLGPTSITFTYKMD